jgi:hypothetical protein
VYRIQYTLCMVSRNYTTITIKKSSYNKLVLLSRNKSKPIVEIVDDFLNETKGNHNVSEMKENPFVEAEKKIAKVIRESGYKKKFTPVRIRPEEAYL